MEYDNIFDLFPKVKRPYYIYAPDYTHKSSGVRVLHLLCHALNKIKQKAYIVPSESGIFNPHLLTPHLTAEIYQFYQRECIEPVIIYPDIVKGNPLEGRKIVRYLLAPAGAYGGDFTFPDSDMVWSYTTPIARSQNSDRVLCIPTFDPKIFYPPMFLDSIRSGSCYYSHKYDDIHGNKLLDITKDSIRLEGTPYEIAETLRSCSVCYVYEMTEVIVLARLCGCEVRVVETDYFKGIPKDLDFFEDGGVVPVKTLLTRFVPQLCRFVEETQKL